jgi:DNA polymerase III epsilon subunit-like protein
MIGHNIGFDIGMLNKLFQLLEKDLFDYFERSSIDTMLEQENMEMGQKGSEDYLYNLGACCERMGIKLHSAHGAEADVEATCKLFIKQTKIKRKNKADTQETMDDTTAAKSRVKFEM